MCLRKKNPRKKNPRKKNPRKKNPQNEFMSCRARPERY